MTELTELTDLPADKVPAMALWLLARIERIRHHEAGAELLDEITTLVKDCWRQVDRPGIVRYLPCPSYEPCEGRIRVTAETIHARCDSCEWETDDLLWLGRMLRAEEPALVTAIDACHRLLVEGYAVNQKQIARAANTGKATIHGRDSHGRNLYDLDEIRRVALAKTAMSDSGAV